MAASGDTVEWFSAKFSGARREEEQDGIHFVRRGQQWTVHWAAFRHYYKALPRKFDVVVDQINTIPFFTPIWSKVPAVAFFHQLAREVWWYESPFPINATGFALEPVYLRVYRRTPIITVSNSTCSDLRALGFKGPITVVPEGRESIGDVQASKSNEPRFVYVGRLSPSKRIGDIIRAFALFRGHEGCGDLHIVGQGSPDYANQLQRLARQLSVAEFVTFIGHASTQEKHSLMAQAHVLLLASVREGWGLVVIEANAVGTPAIAYNVHGLRDSIRDGQTGLLVDPTPLALEAAMRRVWLDQALLHQLSDRALSWSKTFDYDTTSHAFRAALHAALAHGGAAVHNGTELGS